MKRFAFFILVMGLPCLTRALQQSVVADQLETSTSRQFFESILRDDTLAMKLESDFKALQKNKGTKDYQPAILYFTDNTGKKTSLEIEIRPRGKMRRRLCDIPPLKIRLPGKGEDPRTLKMVTFCKDSPKYEQYLLREYFAYKLYNMLTDVSFRVQLVKMYFKDTNGEDAPSESFAILIENEKDLVKRVNGFTLPDGAAEPDNLRTQEVEIFCLFQYMIGNTDWFPITSHNLKILGLDGKNYPVLVPYDFDYSGLVNAPYATSDKRLELVDVTNRYYQGMKRETSETLQTFGLFLSKKADVMGFCEKFPYFDGKSRKHVVKYLREFYEIIEQPRRYKQEILKHTDLWIKL